MIEQDSRLPGDLIYGNSHAVYSALERPMRCTYDPRWHWPEPAEPLPPRENRVISWALIRRWIGGEAAALMLTDGRTGGER